jgi:subtilisin
MNTPSPETRGAETAFRTKGSARKGVGSRPRRYMIAPTNPADSADAVIERLQRLDGVDIVRTLGARPSASPPIVVARMTDEATISLHQSAGGKLVIEHDQPLLAAAAVTTSLARPSVATTPLGLGFAVTVKVVGEDDEPIEHAEVQLVGQQTAVQGQTDGDGTVTLHLYGETHDGVCDILVKPRSTYWGVWKRYPQFQTDGTTIVTLRPLPPAKRFGWNAQAMRLDRLPTGCRGSGVKIALIDSGVATSHKQLAAIAHGYVISGDDEEAWSQDPSGHGTSCAGVISGSEVAECIGGHAPDAELHVCRLPNEAYCSDLVAALDYCLQSGIDLACVGFGCRSGSAIVEQRLEAAKRAGIAVVAAAGSTGESVLFPACSRHALAVGAIGQVGTYPEDAPNATHVPMAARARGGLFVPIFSCRGPELDLCAPGLAVIACQSPRGYVAGDGTSLAAAHVSALAALVLAHGADFQGEFARRNARRVERLFQILKTTAQMIGFPVETGAGIPDALRALGLPPQAEPLSPPLSAGLRDMRNALRLAGLKPSDGGISLMPEPPRGPAAIMQSQLTLRPPSIAPRGAKSSVSELKAAMKMAGLSAP